MDAEGSLDEVDYPSLPACADAAFAVEAQVVHGLVDPLDGLVESVVDLSQLTLVSHHQLLGLDLPLSHVLVSVLLDLLQESADCCFLLLPEGPQLQLQTLVVGDLFILDFLQFHVLNFLLNPTSLFVLLKFH